MKSHTNDQDIGQRGNPGVLFRNGTMDFLASWLLGYAQQGGMSPGALLYSFSLIRNGDPASWVSTFRRAGEESAQRAEAAGRAGLAAEAIAEWSATQIAFRAALAMSEPATVEAAAVTRRMTHAFEEFLAASGSPLVGWQVDFDDTYLPTYVTPGFDTAEDLLMIVGGGDTYVEDLWFFGAKAAIERNWAVLIADFPGQGDTPSRGLHFGEPTVRGMQRVADAIRERGYRGTLTLMGWSGGGIFTTRFAATARPTDRVEALVASTPIYDPGGYFRRALPRILQRQPESLLVRGALAIVRRNPVLRAALARYDWQFGPGGLAEIAQRFDELTIDPSELDVPTLALVGLSEDAESRRQAEHVISALEARHPSSELVTFDSWTGGQAHCQVGNLPLALGQALDWLAGSRSGTPSLAPS